MSDHAEHITAAARELKFAAVGFAHADPVNERERVALQAWLDGGKHGEMDYLARNRDVRLDPRLLLPGAKTAVMVLDLYASRQDPTESDIRDGEQVIGRIAKYARGMDYHRHLKARLHQLADFIEAELDPPASTDGGRGVRAFVDTAPVLERHLAARAGLGAVGKHTLLIHPRLGSWAFIGGLLTTLDVRAPDNQRTTPDLCGSCTACIDACPTRAITPYSVDARSCISYLTIEHRSPIDPRFHGTMRDAGYIFGCDICQQVCPHNAPLPEGSARAAALPTTEQAYEPFEDAPDRTDHGSAFDLLRVLGWSEDDRRAALERSAMKRAKLGMFTRNAAILSGAPELDPSASPST